MIGKEISHYMITEKVGEGGMGTVYKAVDTLLHRTVAFKFLPAGLTNHEESKQRFIHEAQAASALDHPNICTIHEINETEDGCLYIVMACYGDGETLRDKIETKALSLEESIDIFIQIADGLSAAHEKGIIHRDIKPENIIVTSQGIVKILDFGLAKLTGQTQLTTEGSTLGTAAYMSPEQAMGNPIDQRSDIFSLCMCMYELMAGIHPFPAEHQLAIIYSIINESPTPIRELQKGIPEKLAAIIHKGLQKEPEDRYPDLKEMIHDLETLGRSEKYESKSKENATSAMETVDKKNRFWYRKPVWIVFPILIAIGLIYLYYAFSTSREGNNHTISAELIKEAMTALKNNNYDQALTKLNQAVTISPANSLAWSTMAAVSIRRGNLDTAIEQSRRALALNKNNVDAYYNLAYALEEKSLFDQAIANYLIAISIDSLFTQAYSAVGNLLIQQEQAQAAIEILRLAERKTPQSEYMFLIHKNLGKAYYYLKQYERAISQLQFSLRTQPVDMPESWYYLGLCYRDTGRKKLSLEAFQHYLRIETDEQKKATAQAIIEGL